MGNDAVSATSGVFGRWFVSSDSYHGIVIFGVKSDSNADFYYIYGFSVLINVNRGVDINKVVDT